MKALRFVGQITGISTRVDGGMGVRLTTPEFNSEEKAALFDLNNLFVDVLIYPTDEKDADVVKVKKQMDGKTPSQRLRGVLYALWAQEGSEGNLEQWYGQRMEQFINEIKNQLPEKS